MVTQRRLVYRNSSLLAYNALIPPPVTLQSCHPKCCYGATVKEPTWRRTPVTALHFIPVIWLRGNAALKRPFMGSLASDQIGWEAVCLLLDQGFE